jgi:hypothetical protein
MWIGSYKITILVALFPHISFPTMALGLSCKLKQRSKNLAPSLPRHFSCLWKEFLLKLMNLYPLFSLSRKRMVWIHQIWQLSVCENLKVYSRKPILGATNIQSQIYKYWNHNWSYNRWQLNTCCHHLCCCLFST